MLRSNFLSPKNQDPLKTLWSLELVQAERSRHVQASCHSHPRVKDYSYFLFWWVSRLPSLLTHYQCQIQVLDISKSIKNQDLNPAGSVTRPQCTLSTTDAPKTLQCDGGGVALINTPRWTPLFLAAQSGRRRGNAFYYPSGSETNGQQRARDAAPRRSFVIATLRRKTGMEEPLDEARSLFVPSSDGQSPDKWPAEDGAFGENDSLWVVAN